MLVLKSSTKSYRATNTTTTFRSTNIYRRVYHTKSGIQNTNIQLKDILYIESMDNYVRIHLTSQPTLTSQMSLKTLQELLPEEKFIRVHKSFVVPIYRIASYTSKEILLYNGIKIPVGRSYSKYLKDKNSKMA